MQTDVLMAEFEDGRTDLLGHLLDTGIPANFQNPHGVSLMQTCAYYGDVTALRTLLCPGCIATNPWPKSRIEYSLLSWTLAAVPSAAGVRSQCQRSIGREQRNTSSRLSVQHRSNSP
jgi:hypothetical protein